MAPGYPPSYYNTTTYFSPTYQSTAGYQYMVDRPGDSSRPKSPRPPTFRQAPRGDARSRIKLPDVRLMGARMHDRARAEARPSRALRERRRRRG